MSQYRANLCQTTCTGPHTMFGLSVGLPSARRLARHRHLAAMPASMQASEEPMAEAPTVLAASGAFHRSASMCTQRRSISAVCGYSSLSIMFLLIASAIRARTSGSSHVWQNVARFWRALPSSITSSDTSWNASRGSLSSRGNRYLGDRPGQVAPGEHAVLQLVTDGVTLVQRHSRHLLDRGRSAPGSRGMAPLSGGRRHCSRCGRTTRTSSPIAGEIRSIPGPGSLL